jgi:uncharacterized protein
MAKQPEPKFLADENVVKLGKWLRILGYDVAYQFPASDAQLAHLARREERILLTRDREFLERRIAEQCLLLKSQDTVEQLRHVVRTFGLKLDNNRLFTRCLACNVPVESIPKAEAESAVPTDVYQSHDEFHRCPNCDKVFWKGSHTRNFQKWLEEIGG